MDLERFSIGLNSKLFVVIVVHCYYKFIFEI